MAEGHGQVTAGEPEDARDPVVPLAAGKGQRRHLLNEIQQPGIDLDDLFAERRDLPLELAAAVGDFMALHLQRIGRALDG